MMITPAQLLEFWFSERVAPLRFRSTPAFDQEISEGYLELLQQAQQGELQGWQQSPDGCLALVIVLDQLPHHIYRNRVEAYTTEAQSRQVAQWAIEQQFDSRLSGAQRAFLYLPYMHSESATDQQRSVELFTQLGQEENLRWARHHQGIIRRFGRFPHRNQLLGRESSPEEIDYLNSKEGYQG